MGQQYEVPGKALYVGGLSPMVNEAALAEIFRQVGQLSEVKIIKDKTTHANAGYGFVKFVNPDHAAEAIQNLSGRVMYGQVSRRCPLLCDTGS